jgi:hypothetical protein
MNTTPQPTQGQPLEPFLWGFPRIKDAVLDKVTDRIDQRVVSWLDAVRIARRIEDDYYTALLAANDLAQQQAQRIVELEQQLAAARAERRYVPVEGKLTYNLAQQNYLLDGEPIDILNPPDSIRLCRLANVQACTERSERGSDKGESQQEASDE